MTNYKRWWSVLALVMLSLGVTSGCSSTRGPAPVDATVARGSLQKFLDTWKAGKPLAQLQEVDPSLVANDEDWSAGRKLVSYKVLDNHFNDGSNLHVKTVLKLRGKKGKPREQEVTYVVSTSPRVTIFRQ
ncbi:MAG: hypothetical protein U0795_08010 [Pirellulales bacterium]